MYEYDEECLKTFILNQGQLFDEPVAETLEEAEAFLEDCMASIVDSIEEVKEFLDRFPGYSFSFPFNSTISMASLTRLPISSDGSF